MHARSHSHQLCKSLLSREYDGSLCVLVHGRHIAAKLRDPGRPKPRKRQTKGMRQLVRQCKGIMEASQGLIRVSQQPESLSGISSAGNAQILANTEYRRTALFWRVECNTFFQALA